MSRARNLAADVDAVAVGSDGSPTAAVSVRSRSATERVAVNRWQRAGGAVLGPVQARPLLIKDFVASKYASPPKGLPNFADVVLAQAASRAEAPDVKIAEVVQSVGSVTRRPSWGRPSIRRNPDSFERRPRKQSNFEPRSGTQASARSSRGSAASSREILRQSVQRPSAARDDDDEEDGAYSVTV